MSFVIFYVICYYSLSMWLIVLLLSFISSSYFFTHLRVLHTSISWWFSTLVWATCLFKSPGLFLVFWSISSILYFEWSPLVFLFLSPPVVVAIIWKLYRVHQLRLVSPPSHIIIIIIIIIIELKDGIIFFSLENTLWNMEIWKRVCKPTRTNNRSQRSNYSLGLSSQNWKNKVQYTRYSE